MPHAVKHFHIKQSAINMLINRYLMTETIKLRGLHFTVTLGDDREIKICVDLNC